MKFTEKSQGKFFVCLYYKHLHGSKQISAFIQDFNIYIYIYDIIIIINQEFSFMNHPIINILFSFSTLYYLSKHF